MLKWCHRADELRADNASVTLAKKFVSGRSEAWYPEAEAIVISRFRDARAHGSPCNCLWFQVKMQETLQELYPDGSADDFIAGDGWRTRFFKRFNLSMRTATNVMPLSVAERVPKCLRFYCVIQQVCAKDGGMNDIWGRFTPHHRFNADEVPIEFGGALDRTAEEKGAKRVWVKHPMHPIENRECTMMPLFCGGGALPAASILLRCAPKKMDLGTAVDPRVASYGPHECSHSSIATKARKW